MKITRKQLKRIIQEEIGRVLGEEGGDSGGNKPLADAIVNSPEFKQEQEALEGKSDEEIKQAAAAELGSEGVEKLLAFLQKNPPAGQSDMTEREGDILLPSIVGLGLGAVTYAVLAMINGWPNTGLEPNQMFIAFKWAGLLSGMVWGVGDVAQQAARGTAFDIPLTGRTEEEPEEELEEAIRREIAYALG